MSGDADAALGLAVVADALQFVNLGQFMDDPAMVSVHWLEGVGSFCLFSLVCNLNQVPDFIFDLGDKVEVFSGIFFEAVAVHRRGAGVKRV